MIGEASLIELLFNLFVFLLLLYVSFKNLKSNNPVLNWIVSAGIIVFCVYAYWGRDFFRYEEIFEIYQTSHELGHVEEAYVLLYSLSPNYLFFRLLLWGGSFLILLFAFHRVRIKTPVVIFLLVAFYLLRFSYARVSLGVAIMFLGYTYFVMPMKRKALISYIIGFLFLVLSYGFHKSMVLAVIPIPFSFIKWNRNTILLSLIVIFPILSLFVNTDLVDFVLNRNIIEDEIQLSAFNSYLSDTGKENGIGIIIADILQLLPFYLTIIHYFVNYKDLNQSNNKMSRLASGLLFTMVFVATAFVFRQQLIFRRVLYMAYPALILTVALLLEKEGRSKWIKTMVLIGVCYQLYELFYAIYCL